MTDRRSFIDPDGLDEWVRTMAEDVIEPAAADIDLHDGDAVVAFLLEHVDQVDVLVQLAWANGWGSSARAWEHLYQAHERGARLDRG